MMVILLESGEAIACGCIPLYWQPKKGNLITFLREKFSILINLNLILKIHHMINQAFHTTT